MVFTKKLRERIRNGEITTTIRIWKQARVKVHGRYPMEEGAVLVTAVREISFDDVSDVMARESGFLNRIDWLKTAKHGTGQRLFFIRFVYETK